MEESTAGNTTVQRFQCTPASDPACSPSFSAQNADAPPHAGHAVVSQFVMRKQ